MATQMEYLSTQEAMAREDESPTDECQVLDIPAGVPAGAPASAPAGAPAGTADQAKAKKKATQQEKHEKKEKKALEHASLEAYQLKLRCPDEVLMEALVSDAHGTLPATRP